MTAPYTVGTLAASLPGLFGATTKSLTGSGIPEDTTEGVFTTATGITPTCRKLYYQATQFPTTAAGDTLMQCCIDLGLIPYVCYQPAVNGSDMAALTASIAAIQSLCGGKAVCILYQEPQNAGVISAADYITVYQTYASAVRAICPLAIDFAGHAPNQWTAYDPGPDYYDLVGVDFYGNTYVGGVTIQGIVDIAHVGGKPWGVYEMGSAIRGNPTPSQTQFDAYISYIAGLVAADLLAGLPVDAFMWYSNVNLSAANVISSSSDFRVAPLNTLNNTVLGLEGPAAAVVPVTTPTSAGDTIVVSAASNNGPVTGVSDSAGNAYTLLASDTATGLKTYVWAATAATRPLNDAPPSAGPPPGTVTAAYAKAAASQQVIVRACPGVVSADQAVNADGTSAAPSVATGTLAAANEWAVAALGAADAAGTPGPWSGGFAPAATVQVPGGPYLAVADQIVSSDAPLTAGAAIVSANWAMALATFKLTSAPNAVTVANPGTQTNTVSDVVSLAMSATDSDAALTTFTWAATGLPNGLGINPSTGAITGTVTTPGTFSVLVTATDSTGAPGSAGFSWAVNRVTTNTVTVTSPGAQANTVGDTVSVAVSATDSNGSITTFTWSATGLPAGLAISPSTGIITGTPTTAQVYSVSVRATDVTGSFGTTTFTWTVSARSGTVSLTNPGAQVGQEGAPASLQVAASDSNPAGVLSYSATGLPPGMSISPSTGLISGTPAQPGTYTPTVTATGT